MVSTVHVRSIPKKYSPALKTCIFKYVHCTVFKTELSEATSALNTEQLAAFEMIHLSSRK